MMKLTGLHLLFTYQCTLECDHCFVWGSPSQSGMLTSTHLQTILDQAQELGTVEWVYFEGGEPFLYYAALLEGVRDAARRGFQVGIVSNGFWATSVEDARSALKPFAGYLGDLSISSDEYHWSEALSQQAKDASRAAEELGIPVGLISVAQPEATGTSTSTGQLPAGESGVMYRGRAAVNLAPRAGTHPWDQFDACPFEDLRDPGRIHLDPFGNTQICQGISIGNVFHTPLKDLLPVFEPQTHPITGPLLEGGPAALARQYDILPEGGFADACHLCYTTRLQLRSQFPNLLVPDAVYGFKG